MTGTINVARTTDGSYLANVAELPGCVARAATRDEAIARVRRNFRDYLELLAQQRFTPPHLESMDPATFAVRDLDSLGFTPEDARGPLREHDMRDFLRHYEASQAALLSLVGSLSQEQLEAAPVKGEWSARDVLDHVLESQVFFLARLEPWPKDEFSALRAVHRLVSQRLSVLEPEDTAGEHTILGQRWNVRRLMRRLLEHQYEHLQQIREVLTKIGVTAPSR